MSSPCPDVVEDCSLEDLSQKPIWHDPTLGDAVSEFCTKYKHSMQEYALQHNLHAKSLLSMFLSDAEQARTLKPYCDFLVPGLDGTVWTDQEKAKHGKDQKEELIKCLDNLATQPWPVESG